MKEINNKLYQFYLEAVIANDWDVYGSPHKAMCEKIIQTQPFEFIEKILSPECFFSTPNNVLGILWVAIEHNKQEIIEYIRNNFLYHHPFIIQYLIGYYIQVNNTEGIEWFKSNLVNPPNNYWRNMEYVNEIFRHLNVEEDKKVHYHSPELYQWAQNNFLKDK